MLDLKGLEVTSEEKEILQHPAVGGVILFSRNFETPEQVEHLISQIHAVRTPQLSTRKGAGYSVLRKGLPVCQRQDALVTIIATITRKRFICPRKLAG